MDPETEALILAGLTRINTLERDISALEATRDAEVEVNQPDVRELDDTAYDAARERKLSGYETTAVRKLNEDIRLKQAEFREYKTAIHGQQGSVRGLTESDYEIARSEALGETAR